VITIEQIVEHILNLKTLDPDFARYALKEYDKRLPWCNIIEKVREALKS